MKYQDIRNAFPKCGLAVTDYGIMLVLPMYRPARYIMQSINNREFHNKNILVELLRSCDTFQIRMSPGIGSCILFEMQMPVDHQMIWHPVEPELSSEEADRLMYQTIMQHDGGSALLKKLEGIDMDDPEAIVRAISERGDEDRGTMISIADVKAWTRLQELASALHESWTYGDYDEEPPEDELEFGVISWFFEAPTTSPVHLKMDRQQKEMITELCEAADVISLEGNTKDETASITLEFYS